MPTNKDKLAILAKPHLTVKDIQILEACGQQRAMEMADRSCGIGSNGHLGRLGRIQVQACGRQKG